MRAKVSAVASVAAFLLAAGVSAAEAQQSTQSPPPARGHGRINLADWPTPDTAKLPDDHYGRLVRYGEKLATETHKFIGPEAKDPAKRFAGNNLACQSCHLQAGTLPFAMPYIGVSASFPQYRAREDDVQTLEDRVNGCMERSMAGRKLALDSTEMRAFIAYFNFLSQNVPLGAKLEGTGTKPVKEPNRAADPVRGATVYKEQCASCHGDNGEGVRRGVAGDGEGYQFPPLWGDDSYNTGAGMYRVLTALQFIYSNMPIGTTHDAPALSVDDAYDVAAYVNSQPRRVKGGLDQDFPNILRKPVDAPFPPYIGGFPPEQHKFGPFEPIRVRLEQLRAEARAKKEKEAK